MRVGYTTCGETWLPSTTGTAKVTVKRNGWLSNTPMMHGVCTDFRIYTCVSILDLNLSIDSKMGKDEKENIYNLCFNVCPFVYGRSYNADPGAVRNCRDL